MTSEGNPVAWAYGYDAILPFEGDTFRRLEETRFTARVLRPMLLQRLYVSDRMAFVRDILVDGESVLVYGTTAAGCDNRDDADPGDFHHRGQIPGAFFESPGPPVMQVRLEANVLVTVVCYYLHHTSMIGGVVGLGSSSSFAHLPVRP